MREETEEWKEDLEQENRLLREQLRHTNNRIEKDEEKLTEIMRMLKECL